MAKRRRRMPGWHFLRVRGGSIPLGSKAKFAISEARRFGSSGKELRFALMTVKNRVREGQREMFPPGQSFEVTERVKALNRAFGTDRNLKKVFQMIDAERAKARREKSPALAGPEKPLIDVKGLRPELVNMVRGVAEFGWETSIKTRHAVFQNVMNETRKGECEHVSQWLGQMGDYYLHKARNAKSYSNHANLADYALRCYGAASHLYSKFGFNAKSLEIQKRSYAAIARLGLA